MVFFIFRRFYKNCCHLMAVVLSSTQFVPSSICNPRFTSFSHSLSIFPNFSFKISKSAIKSRSFSSVHGPLPEPSYSFEDLSFDRAVSLFNEGDYHLCHDYLEELWNEAEEPIRTILHGILQCAVGFHHLFNQNHRGAMMEMGEGLCKLRKMEFGSDGPLYRFEKEVSKVLEFVYQTQKELAACSEDVCVAMDGSERSYQLLGSFAAGIHVYNLYVTNDGIRYIIFCPDSNNKLEKSLRVRIPLLAASEEHLKAFEYS